MEQKKKYFGKFKIYHLEVCPFKNGFDNQPKMLEKVYLCFYLTL